MPSGGFTVGSTAMTLSPAAPPAVRAVVEPAAAASKCPASPGGVNKESPAATAAAASKNEPTSPTEAENSSWLINTPERRPSYYGGVPFDVAQSAMTASSRSSTSNRGGGFGTSNQSGGNIDGSAAATTSGSTTSSTAKNHAAGGAGRKRLKWEDSEPAPLSSLKKLLEGLEERCAEAGVSFGESRSVFGSGTAVSGRTSRPSWSLSSSSSSSSRRRRRTGSSSSSGGRSSIVRIGSIGDGSSSHSDQAGLLGSGVTMANGKGGKGGGDAGDVGLVSANKKSAAKRARGEGDDVVDASLGMPTSTLTSAAGLMSPPSPSVTKSVLKRRT